MAGRIPQQFIDELLNRIDIVDVVDSRVPLRKAGRDYQARCPFHEEKSPSFTVSPSKQFYHCFGCGAHGSAIGFLMEYDHLDFVEAVKELAQKAGMELPEQEQPTPQQRQTPELHHTMQEAANFYRQQLKHHNDSAKAIAYLKDRGLSGDIAAEFGIGFAPPGWDNLCKTLGTTPQRIEQLITTGMAVRKENNRQYDRFRNRIMFPIRDRRGRVIAFGGRVIDKEDTPKYLNSPESPLFHKGKELYGLFEARQALRQIDRLLVVEGYMDVVALAQHGIRYAVATLGTALTTDHLQPLFRTSSEVVFCFDGDRAGRDAAWKALDIMLPEIKDGRSVRFIFLPEGEDPDTLIRQIGQAAFEDRINQAMPLANFLLDNLTQQVDMSAIDGRARLVDLAKPKLNRISNTIYRHMLIEELAGRVNMEVSALMRLLGEKTASRTPKRNAPPPSEPRKLSPVRTAITLLLNDPQLALSAGEPNRYRALSEPGINLLVSMLEICQSNPTITCGSILERWREHPEGKHLSKLAQTPITTPPEGLENEFIGALWRLERLRVDQEYDRLMRKSSTSPLTNEEKLKIPQLLAEKRSLAQPPTKP